MLILTLKMNESVSIGDDIRIKVVRIGGNRIRLGIDCPEEIKVLRERLLSLKRTEEEQK